MSFGVTEIVFAIVAIVAAYLGFTTGRKVERPKAMKEGAEKATNEILQQTTEQTLERVTEAAEARNAVERTPDDELREQASQDPNNRLRGM
jgi:hypothetical protein